MNILDGLAEQCRGRGVCLLIDAVSSFAGEEIAFDRWAPLAVAATANKCLHGAPGAAFVLADRAALDRGDSQANSLYLDLINYNREQRDGGSPFTQAVHVFNAMGEALAELADQGGWRSRRQRYLELSQQLRQCLVRLGVEPLIPLDQSASMMTSFRLPAGLTYAELHSVLKAHGFIIYAGQGVLASEIFRIALMGAISDADFTRLLSVLGQAIAKSKA